VIEKTIGFIIIEKRGIFKEWGHWAGMVYKTKKEARKICGNECKSRKIAKIFIEGEC